MPGYSTKNPLVLYYRDPTECIEFLLKNPLFSGSIQYQPRQDFDTSGGRVYGEWITSNGAWDLQVSVSDVLSHFLFIWNVSSLASHPTPLFSA